MVKHWYRLTEDEARKLYNGLVKTVTENFEPKRKGIKQITLLKYIANEIGCTQALGCKLAFEFMKMVGARPKRKRFRVTPKLFSVYYTTLIPVSMMKFDEPTISWKVFTFDREYTIGRPVKIFKQKKKQKGDNWQSDGEREEWLRWRTALTGMQKFVYGYEWNRNALPRNLLIKYFRSGESIEDVFEKWFNKVER